MKRYLAPETAPGGTPLDEQPRVVFTKTADRAAALPGETIGYTLTLQNQGSAALTTSEVIDSLPAELSLVAGSISPAPAAGERLETGVSLGAVAPGASVSLRYQAVVAAGTAAPVANRASADYTYQSAAGTAVRETVDAPESLVQVPGVNPVLQKTVTPELIQPGGTLQYTLTVKNPSAVPLSDVVLKDASLPAGVTVGAVQLNGAPVPPEQNLQTGILIGTLPAVTGSAVVTFFAKTNPDISGTISNTASAAYSYLSGDTEQSGTVVSNPASAAVLTGGLTVVKTADRQTVAESGSSVEYTVTVTNTGNAPASDVVVTDLLPQGMTYAAGSTVIGSGAAVDLSPEAGIPVGTLAAGSSVSVRFRVIVTL